jgi:hypothetical protein
LDWVVDGSFFIQGIAEKRDLTANPEFLLRTWTTGPNRRLEWPRVNDHFFFGVNVPLQEVLAVVLEFYGNEHFKECLKVSYNHCRNDQQQGQ